MRIRNLFISLSHSSHRLEFVSAQAGPAALVVHPSEAARNAVGTHRSGPWAPRSIGSLLLPLWLAFSRGLLKEFPQESLLIGIGVNRDRNIDSSARNGGRCHLGIDGSWVVRRSAKRLLGRILWLR